MPSSNCCPGRPVDRPLPDRLIASTHGATSGCSGVCEFDPPPRVFPLDWNGSRWVGESPEFLDCGFGVTIELYCVGDSCEDFRLDATFSGPCGASTGLAPVGCGCDGPGLGLSFVVTGGGVDCCRPGPTTIYFSLQVFEAALPGEPRPPVAPPCDPAVRCCEPDPGAAPGGGPDGPEGGGCRGGGKCRPDVDRDPPSFSPGPVRYATGELLLRATDVAAGGFGQGWGHARGYVHRLAAPETIGHGFCWLVEQWPYLVFGEDGAVAAMGPADSALWFDPAGYGYGGYEVYEGRFGVRETLAFSPVTKLYELASPDGSVTTYDAAGRMTKRTSPGGQAVAVVSRAADGFSPAVVERTATVAGVTTTERLEYAYAAAGGHVVLTRVTLRRQTGFGSWQDVERASYTYYEEGTSYDYGSDAGLDADLKTATTEVWDGTAWAATGTTLYRYHTSPGSEHLLKYVVNPASYARLAADPGVSDPPTASDTLVAAYADYYFEYDSVRRVTREKTEGGSKTYDFAYTTSGHAPGPGNWETKTVETLPGGAQNVVYTNRDGRVILREFKQGSDSWVQYQEYDADGRRTLYAHPSAVTSYDDAAADLDVVLKTGDGLIEVSEYWAATGSGGAAGELKAQKVKQGSSGTPVLLREYEYEVRTAGGATVTRVSKEKTFRNDDGTGGIETTYAYTWHSGTTRVEQRTTTLPAVPTAQNGANATATRVERFDVYGNLVWSKDERGVITKQVVDPVLGVVTQRIDDVDTAQTTDEPSGWSTASGFGLHLVTDFAHDARGRLTRTLGPVHDADVSGTATSVRTAHWTVYVETASGREVRSAGGYGSGSGHSTYTLINPVTIAKYDPEGRVLEEIRATRGSGVTSSGALSASDMFAQSSYVAWTTHHRSDCCAEDSVRVYHDVPSSGAGSVGTNYGQTGFGYAATGRRNKVTSPGGTITRTVFDPRGLPIETWVGTNDTGATDADPTGGGAGGNDMVLVSEREYDGNADGGDGRQTKETLYASATDTRVTAYVYDWRGRLVDTDGEEGFFERRYYDSLGRVTKAERYDGTTSGMLLARSETFYDERGRGYRTKQHEVDPTTGAVGSSLTDDVWYDQSGNVTKRQPDGVMEYVEFSYDGLGRVKTETDPRAEVTSFAYNAAGERTSLADAESNDTTWAYDPVGRVVRETNELNDARSFEYSAAGNLAKRTDRLGRVTEFTYDDAGRVTSEVWKTGVTTASTITAGYNVDGRVTSVSDSSATYAYGYDGLGRLTSVDNNGTSGVPRVILTSGHDRQDARTSLSVSVAGTADFANAHLFDKLGRVTQTGQTGGNAVAEKRADFSYKKLGGFDAITRYDDSAGSNLVATTTHAYDGYGRLTGATHAQGGAALGAYARTFDSDRRVGTASTPDGSTTYGYDDAGQLTSADHTYQTDEAYGYDGTGNRTNTGYSTGTNNRLLNDGTYSYAYDAEGNRTLRTKTATGEKTEYTWDHRNRLTSISFKTSANVLAKRVAYVYDPQDRRIVKKLDANGDGTFESEERFAFDQFVKGGLDDAVLVFDQSNAIVSRLLHGPAVDQPLADERLSAGVLWYLADPLGSVRDVVQRNPGTGVTSVLNRARYDSFGNVTNQTNVTYQPRHGFTGRDWDADAGMWWYRARWYDPFNARFLSEDPVGFRAADINMTRYTRNSPANMIDLAGTSCVLQICANPVDGPCGDHLFVNLTDGSGTRTYRGGPQKGGPDYGPVEAGIYPWDPQCNSDWRPNNELTCSQITLKNECDCENLITCLAEVARRINDANIPYNVAGDNCNSVVGWGFEGCLRDPIEKATGREWPWNDAGARDVVKVINRKREAAGCRRLTPLGWDRPVPPIIRRG